nr:S8 family serine peptidase [Lachnospiraceae bacterium]
MGRISLAIIDDGIAELASGPSIRRYMVHDGHVCPDDEKAGPGTHGSVCARIILKYCSNVSITSIRILKDDRGSIDDLITALKWCADKGFSYINTSLGIVSYERGDEMNRICRELNRRGTAILASQHNYGRISYPAFSPWVISVADIGHICGMQSLYNAADIYCKSVHLISDGQGHRYLTDRSNSYACAYATALLCRGKRIDPVTDMCFFSHGRNLLDLSVFSVRERKALIRYDRDIVRFRFGDLIITRKV